MKLSYKNLLAHLTASGLKSQQICAEAGISSATLARIRAGEPVSLDALGRLCDYLQHPLSELVQMEPDAPNEVPWSSIDPETHYTITIFLNVAWSRDLQMARATYLFGYASPFTVAEEVTGSWHSEYDTILHRENCDFYGITLQINLSGQLLRQFMSFAGYKCLADIATELELGIWPDLNWKKKSKKEPKAVMAAIREVYISNGSFLYRPPFRQVPASMLCHLQEGQRPLACFNDSLPLCESLYGLFKITPYCHEAEPDYQLLQAIFNFLRKHLPISRHPAEMIRLNNFEVHLPLCHQTIDSLLQLEPVKDDNHCNKPPRKLRLMLDKTARSQEVAVQLTVCNSINPVMDRLILIPPSTEDYIHDIDIPESFSYVEAKAWTHMVEHNGSCTLASCRSFYLIRDIPIKIHVLEPAFGLEDAWQKRLAKKQGARDSEGHESKVTPFTAAYSVNNDRVHAYDEPWYFEESKLTALLADICSVDSLENSDAAFFHGETQKDMSETISWLRNCLARHVQTGTKQVIIIDPYIDATVLGVLARFAENQDLRYIIYTEENAQNESSDEAAARIQALTELVKEFRVVLPELLEINLLDGTNVLHDRLLILLGNAPLPVVYSLSGSLNGFGITHASSAIRCPASLAIKEYEYYSQLISQRPYHTITITDEDQSSKSVDPSESSETQERNSTEASLRLDLGSIDDLEELLKNDDYNHWYKSAYNPYIQREITALIKTLSRLEADDLPSLSKAADILEYFPCRPRIFNFRLSEAEEQLETRFPQLKYKWLANELHRISLEDKINISDHNLALYFLLHRQIERFIEAEFLCRRVKKHSEPLQPSAYSWLKCLQLASFVLEALSFENKFAELANPVTEGSSLWLRVRTCKEQLASFKKQEQATALALLWHKLQLISQTNETHAGNLQLLRESLCTEIAQLTLDAQLSNSLILLKEAIEPVTSAFYQDVCALLKSFQQKKILTASNASEYAKRIVLKHMDRASHSKIALCWKDVQELTVLLTFINIAESSHLDDVASKGKKRSYILMTSLLDPLSRKVNYKKWYDDIHEFGAWLAIGYKIYCLKKTVKVPKQLIASYRTFVRTNWPQDLEKDELCQNVCSIWDEDVSQSSKSE